MRSLHSNLYILSRFYALRRKSRIAPLRFSRASALRCCRFRKVHPPKDARRRFRRETDSRHGPCHLSFLSEDSTSLFIEIPLEDLRETSLDASSRYLAMQNFHRGILPDLFIRDLVNHFYHRLQIWRIENSCMFDKIYIRIFCYRLKWNSSIENHGFREFIKFTFYRATEQSLYMCTRINIALSKQRKKY